MEHFFFHTTLHYHVLVFTNLYTSTQTAYKWLWWVCIDSVKSYSYIHTNSYS